MKAINLTPHAITLHVGGRDIVIPPSGKVARVAVVSTDCGSVDINGIQVPVVVNERGKVEAPGFVEDDDAICIVSSIVLRELAGYRGFYAPDTGATAIRDEKGQIKAVTRLIAAE